MARTSQEIPPEVWEQHKETILGLRYGENLPLDDTKTGGRSMIQVMRDEHRFQATVSQYETQLKKWAAVKNLKKRDWETILPVYDKLKEQGLEPRVRVGAYVLEERRIKRARRYPKRGGTTLEGGVEPVASSAHSNFWTVEVRRSDGQYTEYSIEHGGPNEPEAPSSSALIQRSMNNSPFGIESQPLQGDLVWLPECPLIAAQFTPRLVSFPPAIPSPRNNPDILYESHGQDMLSDLPLFNSHAWALSSPSASEIYNTLPLLNQWTLSKGCIDMMLWSVSQEPKFKLALNPGALDAQVVLDDLTSLVDDDFFETRAGDSLALVFHGKMTTSDIHKRIIFSIVNNFAGLHYIPPVILFGMLRIDLDISSCLFDCLRSDDPTIAKPLAVNLFRAAIEAGDEEALSIILTAISGRMNEIRLDRAVCEYQGHTYTPIALASRLHHFGVVQVLLSHGANVYVTSTEPNDRFIGCALTAMLPHSDMSNGDIPDLVQASTEITKIAKVLVANGAKMSVHFLGTVIHNMRESGELLEICVQAILKERHHEFFGSEEREFYSSERDELHGSILPCIVRELKDQLADKIIRNVLMACQISNCTPACAVQHPEALDRSLYLAILKGNSQLAEYLLGHIRPADGHLAAAIHSGQLELVNTIMKQGSCVRGSAVCFVHMSHAFEIRERYPDCKNLWAKLCHWDSKDTLACEPTTRLAEAVRLQNTDLLRRLEQYGALNGDFGNKKLESQAAISAAAEIGDSSFLKRLLALLPTQHRVDLRDPTEKALKMGNVEAAETLIPHLARAETTGTRKINECERNGHLLSIALKLRHQSLVDTLLEHFSFNCSDSEVCGHSTAVQEAARSGDKSLLECLIRMGLKWTTSPLHEAIATRKHELAAVLLEWGFPPRGLGKAVELGDESMVRLLLQHGASIRDDDDVCCRALRAAIETRNAKFAALLLERRAYHCGLDKAVELGDESMVRLLLQHGASPADEAAFSIAIDCGNQVLQSVLFEAFSLKYPNGLQDFGGRALMSAVQSGNTSVLKRLLGLKLKVHCYSNPCGVGSGVLQAAIRSSKESNLEMISQLLDADAGTEEIVEGNTALLEAISVKSLPAVRLLLSRGSNVNRPARRGLKRTPLQKACEQGSFPIVELLLDYGAELNAPPALSGGATALQLAAIQGSVRIIRLLLDKGADIHGAPAALHGRTALEGAAEHGRMSVMNILLAEGAAGYGVEEIESAKAFAEKRGHHGCGERLKLALFRLGEARRLRQLL